MKLDAFAHPDGIAVVTGAAGGIGRGVCDVLAELGLRVVGLDIEREVEPPVHPNVELRRADVTDAEAIEEVVADLAERESPTTVLVNNAGILGAKQETDALEIEEWQRVISANLTSAFLCSRAIVPLMKANRFGRIINVSSLGAQTGAIYASSAYTSSKGGLLALTKTMSRELAGFGITVNAISPARIDGPVFWQASEELGHKAADNVPVGRLGKPLDVAYAVAYLASPVAGFVTAQTLNVNGGVWTQ